MSGMRASDAIGTMQFDMVETAKGCKEMCIHCGAYDSKMKPDDAVVRPLSREEVEAHLRQEIVGTRKSVADCLADYVTTGVNTEPLLSDAFIDLAELAHELSDGRSRAVCISHGLRTGSKGRLSDSRKPTGDRLGKVVKLMIDNVVPVFVLTVDLARGNGKIKGVSNVASYAATLQALRPALKAGKRVTVSIQGDDNVKSRYYRARADRVWAHVLRLVDLSPEEQSNLHYDRDRHYVAAGRAMDLVGGLSEGAKAPVIPDMELAEAIARSQSAVPYRGMVDIRGGLWRQHRQWDRTYNTTVGGPWERLVNGDENSEAGGGGVSGGGGGLLKVLQQPGGVARSMDAGRGDSSADRRRAGGGGFSYAEAPHRIAGGVVRGTRVLLDQLAFDADEPDPLAPAGVRSSAILIS